MSVDGDQLKVLVVQHEADAGSGIVGERLAAEGCAIKVCGPAEFVPGAAAIPQNPDGWDGVVVLGGTPGPTDDARAPWLPDVRALIAGCLDGEVPLLAICLGAQLLAHVSGGAVAALTDGPEIGVEPLWLTDAAFGDALFSGLEPPLQAMQWHELEVAELPPGARLLCRGDDCVNQAFRVGRFGWGLQFHLEVAAEGVLHWARAGAADLSAAGLSGSQLVADMRAAEPGLRALWEPVVDRWVGACITQRNRTDSA